MIRKNSNSSLARMISAFCAVFFVSALTAAGAFAIDITGKVTGPSGLGEPGVVVFVKSDKSYGAMTDNDGNYSISVKSKEDVLVFSLLGYKDVEEKVGNRTRINVILTEDSTLLNEVLVVGYGTQKKEFVVGSVSQVTSKDILKAPNTNVSAMLTGKLAGVSSIQSSGIPGGDGAAIYVRGITSFNGSSPLILVDGVERSMSYINPNDIETISVLKDAATASIYGVRGSNGVVVITTKKGRNGAATLNYDGSCSFDANTVTPDLLNAKEYIYYHNRARELDGQTPYWTPEIIASLKERGLYGEVDNWKLIYNPYGFTQQHNISATGGSDKTKYYTSIGYMDQQGILKRTSMQRINVRASIDTQLKKGLNYSINLSAANTERIWPGLNMMSSSGSWQGEFSPLRQACYAIPILATTYNGLPLGYTNGTYTYTPEAALNTGFQSTEMWLGELRTKLEYDFGEGGVKFLQGLKASISLAYNFDYCLNRNLLETFQLYSYDPRFNTVTLSTSLGIGETNFAKAHSMGYNSTIRPQLNYDRDFGKHHVSALALFEAYNYHGDTMTGYKTGYVEGAPIDISMGQTNLATPVTGSNSYSASASFAGRVSYAYDKKYLAEATFREDGSYKFAPQSRWGFFPSLALGWVISNEEFMKEAYNVNYLKLRLSAGSLGQDDIEAWQYLMTYRSTAPTYTYMIGGTPYSTFYTSGYVHDNLTWSRTNSFNIGTEGRFFNNRLSVELDAYYKYTKNILEYDGTGVFSPSLGGNNPSYLNSGAMDNWGTDLNISWGDAFANGFSYTLTGIVSYSTNRVLKKRIADDHPSYRAILGQPVGSYYGYHALGLFQTQEQLDNAPAAPSGYNELGALMYEDYNGDGKLSGDYDFVKIGRSSIPELTFSLNVDLAYKAFSFNMLLQGATLCNYALNGTWSNGNMDSTMYTRAFYGGGNTLGYLVKDAWTPENTGAKYPRLSTSVNALNAWASDWWIRDGSYLRVKTAQLAYDVPSKALVKTPLSALRIFLAGTNLLTFSSFKYIDPENPGINNGYYPQQRTVSLGVKATF